MPLFLILAWLTGPLSLLLLGAGPYLLFEWYNDRIAEEWLYAALGLLLLSFMGRAFVLSCFKKDGKNGFEGLKGDKTTVKDTNGGIISVDMLGHQDLDPIIFTHGWSLDSTAWFYQRQALKEKFKLIFWDLPGLGESRRYPDGHYSLEKIAISLNSVVDLAQNNPCILVGHSIGGMVIQKYCQLYPAALREKVAGIVLINTTYTNPLKTMIAGPLMAVLEKPVFRPLMYLSILLSPFVRLMNFASYLNGTAHIVARLIGFSSSATREQIEFVARLNMKMSPAVVAKGNLAMFNWKGEDLSMIDVPVMILSGEDDVLTLPRASQQLHSMFKNGSLENVNSAGHMGFLEQNPTYSARICQFSDFCFLHRQEENDRDAAAELIGPPPSGQNGHHTRIGQ